AAVLEAIGRRRRFRGFAGEVVAAPARAYRALRNGTGPSMDVTPRVPARGDSCVFYADRLVLKLFHRRDGGPHPAIATGTLLSESAGFAHCPKLAGGLQYWPVEGEPVALASLKGFVAHEGDAWQLSLDGVGRYYDRIAGQSSLPAEVPLPREPLLDLC